MGMTQDEFRKDGWLKYFCGFSQEEVSAMVLGVSALQSMNLWHHYVEYCVAKMNEHMDTFTNEILEDLDENFVSVH